MTNYEYEKMLETPVTMTMKEFEKYQDDKKKEELRLKEIEDQEPSPF